MRLLKKLLRKLYHLIAFLGILILFIPNVKAESIDYSFSKFTTSYSTYSPQCNSTYCVVYNYPVFLNQTFTSRWDSSTTKTCNTNAVLSGKFVLEGSDSFDFNLTWLERYLQEVYISTNGTTYYKYK